MLLNIFCPICRIFIVLIHYKVIGIQNLNFLKAYSCQINDNPLTLILIVNTDQFLDLLMFINMTC